MTDRLLTSEKVIGLGRNEALRLLADIALEFPHLRLCQIVGNACGPDPYYLTDRELVAKLRVFREVMRGA